MRLALPFLVSLVIILMSRSVVAPFPPSHPYSFLNPVIDPWWQKLDKETQKQVYSLWQNHEPSLFALGKIFQNYIHPSASSYHLFSKDNESG